jgi:hypothetical protein
LLSWVIYRYYRKTYVEVHFFPTARAAGRGEGPTCRGPFAVARRLIPTPMGPIPYSRVSLPTESD